MPSLMIQGAGSNVGKSLLVAGLCRAAKLRGLSVAPFKPQNMSNNAAVTHDGGEIGRAQALQAMAAGILPMIDMNPVLLKPESETGAQVIVQGQRVATVRARDYAALKPKLLSPVLESFHRLRARYDVILVEGAGSPAEVNLRAGDIANMGFAVAANVPVVLVGDIDRGGVIAQMVGTYQVLSSQDRAMIAGFMINKFRGDASLFDDGYHLIAQSTGWPGFGVVPFFDQAHLLPAEDAQDLPKAGKAAGFKVAVLTLSRIANFDDLDPLSQTKGVQLMMVKPGQAIPGDCNLIIIPGSKSTRGDLAFLRTQGWDIDIAAHVRRGGFVLGICGGYQMLGQTISDPMGIEGPAGDSQGLGLLNVNTVMTSNKNLSRVQGLHCASQTLIEGYEIHIGETQGLDRNRPFAKIAGQSEGATSPDGRIIGSYLHGMFQEDNFRVAFLRQLGASTTQQNYSATVDVTLDALAAHMERTCDVAGLLGLAR
jgi:adenosylcobyric acid synthase